MTIRNQLFRRFALALLLGIGVNVIWIIAFSFSFGFISAMIPRETINENLRYTHDGTPFIESYRNGVITFLELDGKPIEVTTNNIIRPTVLPGQINPHKHFFRPTWSRRIHQADKSNLSENWFFIYDGELHGHGYLIGYDHVTKAKIGYLGRNGFQREKPPLEEQFPIDGQRVAQRSLGSLVYTNYIHSGSVRSDITYLLTENGLLQIDLKNRTVKLLRKDTDVICMVHYVEIPESIGGGKRQTTIVSLLRTPDRLLILNRVSGKEIQSYRLPEAFRYGSFAFALCLDEKILLQRVMKDKKQRELAWIDPSGKITKRQEATLHKTTGLSKTQTAWMACTMAPSIGVVGGTMLIYPWMLAGPGSPGYGAALGRMFQVYWPMLLILAIFSVICAILCYRRQRQYGLPNTWFWVGFVLLFGLPAYLGYLAHRRWPARLPCPSCNEPAPRDREACFVCHEAFPDPSPKGTEVFA